LTDIPDLRSFDWILLNTSSGKDSQTTMRYVVQRCKEAGVEPGRIVAVHADLGEMEWEGCPELAGKQSEHYGLRLITTKRNGGDLLEYVRRRGKWPSPKQRYCTSDFKRGPIRRVMTRLTDDLRRSSTLRADHGPVRILNCMGMRAQESPFRSKMQPLAIDGGQKIDKKTGKLKWYGASNGLREVWNWLPIHQWPIEEVWSDIRASGVPYHQVYDLGMPRLSCSLCIFAQPPALKLAGRLRPKLLDKYVQVEREIGHTFKIDVALVDIQKAIAAGEDAEPVADWRM
jgi:3'-phosphoadenosine 5'-phosphosulfate sulfotransferase (PAPS reductase)/FAD synthetase